MALTTGINKECIAWTGGGERLWLADKADVSSFTLTGGQYTAVTMVSGKVFKEYQFLDDSFELRQNTTRNETSGSVMIEAELECTFQGLNNTIRTALQEIIASSTCGVIAIVEDGNDNKWVVGYGEQSKRALKISQMPVSTGKNQDDLTGAVMTLKNKTPELARVFTGTVPV